MGGYFSFLMGISMGKWPGFEYHVGKWLKYDRFGFTHLNQPWGPPWTLATLGDMLENGQFPPKWPCRKWPTSTLELISEHQTIKGDPNNCLDELEPNRSYLSHFPTWYSKLGHFSIEIPIEKKSPCRIGVMGLKFWKQFLEKYLFWDTLLIIAVT